MFSVATPIWNEIARTQRPKSSPWGQWMALDAPSLTEKLEQQAKELESSGASPRVILSFQTVAPLLHENAAISRYIQAKSNPDLRNALPELTTAAEAISLATAEYSLTQAEQTRLRKLLDQ